MVGSQGVEPRMPEAADLQSAAVTNAARYPIGRSLWTVITLLPFAFNSHSYTEAVRTVYSAFVWHNSVVFSCNH